jgi:Fe-Mn family superoxide dismutase
MNHMSDHNHSRRRFFRTSAQAGIVLTGALAGLSVFESCKTGAKISNSALFKTSFEQDNLPYSFAGLEPVIDARTMEIHFTKHAAGYSANLKDAAKAEGVKASKPVEEVLVRISKYSTKMRNNAGGHFNHELFWKCMRPSGGGKPTGSLLNAIETTFRSFGDFKMQFSEGAKNRFGSGWEWLYLDSEKKLRIGSTPNQDNPLMDVSEIKGMPLLGLDVWEHAYYLKYQNKRADYIDGWWNVVNWDFVQDRYDKAI